MTCKKINGIWHAVIKDANKSYMGYAPSLKEAIVYCWSLKNA